MTGLDTNVLVRHLTGDDLHQSALAARLFREFRDARELLYLPLIVLCETVWVLRGGYRYQRAEIVAALELLLASEGLLVEREDLARRALQLYRTGSADLSDYLIGLIARDAGCSETLTFDRKLEASDYFRALK